MAQRATSLGPKPSLFVFCFVFVLFFLVFSFGPPHLALNPPYLFFLFFFFVVFLFFFVPFLSLCLIEKPCFPPGEGIFCFFSVFPFLSP